MNPVLLKPQSEVGSQIVVQGRVFGSAKAREYQARKPELMPYVLDSFAKLQAGCDIVLVEGAGSASEVNLRANDIANMGFARAVDAPVILIGDIDRGGVIASLCGTAAVIDPEDAKLIAGFIVNKMRGDPSLFASGMRFVAERTGWAAIGLVPHFRDAHRLPAEDVLGLETLPTPATGTTGQRVRIVVPVLPHIANFDDLDPLRLEPGIELILLRHGAPLPVDTDLVILPGSKATIADLAALRSFGWDADLLAHARRGGRVLGLCGGYQMLGATISDPDGIEGPPGSADGLGLIDITTELAGDKSLVAVRGRTLADDVAVSGYEMHIGRTAGAGTRRPLIQLDDGRTDGAISANGLIAGTYLHGFFAGDAQRAAWLARLGAPASPLAYEELVEQTLDALAAHLEAHLDVEKLLSLAR
jgi:adenosylcobyric acid synthase